MKKSLLFLGFTIISPLLFAQITITSADMPGSGDTIRYSNVNPASIDVNITGPNHTWIFDTVSTISEGVYEYKSALNTPYAFYFFGLNKYGLKTADSLGVGAFSFHDIYSFYKKSNGKFEAEGTGMTYQGIPLAAYYGDNDEIYTFPLNYSDRDSTTFDYTIQVPGVMDYIQKGYRINTVDGWGMITTPYGTAACLRVVSDLISVDSININGFGLSFPNNTRTYKWLTNTEKIPYLEVSGSVLANNFLATRARYRGVSPLGISLMEATAKDIRIVPNPAGNYFTISSNKSIETVEVYNSLLQVVKHETFTGNNASAVNMDISSLHNGLYYVMINHKAAQKIVVQH